MKNESMAAIIITLAFLSIGFGLLHFGVFGYGISLFAFLPFIIGYLVGKPVLKKASLIGLIFSVVVFMILLVVGKLEGMVCILMALPFVLGALLLGVLIKYLVKRVRKSDKPDDLIKSSILPFCLFLVFGFVETKLTHKDKTIVEVKTEIILSYTTMQVYEAIKQVDTLDAEKPFLMKLDLPIPQKCILQDEKVGGIRTCYFEGGQIVERITELEKGKTLRMDVIDYQLTGRKWLGFKEAIYHFEALDSNHSKLTRITTYSSELYPRFYWEPLEEIGIQQEHEYVFRNLIKDLAKG